MPPPRVVSLLPSATEHLFALGAGHLLVGRSHECDFPPSVTTLPALTASRLAPGSPSEIDTAVRAQLSTANSLYTLNEPLLAALKPDLIITQSLCEVCSIDLTTVERVAASLSPRPAVVSLNPHSVEAVFDDLFTIAAALEAAGAPGATAAARHTAVALRERMYTAADFAAHLAGGLSVACLEWCDPLFIAGHWTPQLIERAGGTHPLNPTAPTPHSGAAAGPVGASMATAGKSVRVPAEVLAASRPEAVIIAPCGVPLADIPAHAASLFAAPWWKTLPAEKTGRVALVDGNQMFSRPGPRLVDAYCWLVGWLNDRPEVIPQGFPWRACPNP
jgi:ABC-type Fe3+-hydroxamate transport system substrate-binding protein